MTQCAKWLAYSATSLHVHPQVNKISTRCAPPGVPLLVPVASKLKVKRAVSYIGGSTKKHLVSEARIGTASMGSFAATSTTQLFAEDFGIRYINCGDWVESCTAIAEHANGHFEIIVWTHTRPALEPVEADGQ